MNQLFLWVSIGITVLAAQKSLQKPEPEKPTEAVTPIMEDNPLKVPLQPVSCFNADENATIEKLFERYDLNSTGVIDTTVGCCPSPR